MSSFHKKKKPNPGKQSKKRPTKKRISPALLHWRKKQKADTTLAKIRTFTGPYQIPQILTYLRKIDPFVFEELLLTTLEESGYRIYRNRRYTGDGGIDGMIEDQKGNQVLLQAKRYASYVRPTDIEVFAKLVQESNAEYGIFVHTGKSGQNTRLKKTKQVSIISGNHLVRLLRQPETTWLRNI